ncbi:uncharacterized protein MKK02DRAFT_41807 [Dioszegia hungarica]|uniref:Thioredoxin domain-containing protein n=1 Tax=Dioszegia hungarica TaxID=4972 RepID=A0AA38HEJ4_9TREE|nr:uncharacterized protein MKK02DRAFT_41807 [Dioszegia hungarica]KAI9638780.1 hypothetical protein MKK02DRAFT_41807 [Dioszegia hungarica]
MPIDYTPYPHVLNQLGGPTAPKYTYLIFYSSIVDGPNGQPKQMWCPDCRDVEGIVKATFGGAKQPKAVIWWVGEKAESRWRTPTNHARSHWNVQSVPTILRLEEGKETARLVEGEILDQDRLAEFVKTE